MATTAAVQCSVYLGSKKSKAIAAEGMDRRRSSSFLLPLLLSASNSVEKRKLGLGVDQKLKGSSEEEEGED